MVEQIGTVQPQATTQKKDNTIRNTAIAGGAGLIAGGTTGYMTKQIMKDNKFTDQFVKEVRKQILEDAGISKNEQKFITAMCKMDENPAIDSIKNFFRKNTKYLDETLGITDDLLKNISDEEIRKHFNRLKQIFDNQIKPAFSVVTENMRSFLEDGKKLFTKQEALKDCDVYKLILKAQHNVKGKAGLIWGTSTGAILGTGAYIASKITEKKES